MASHRRLKVLNAQPLLPYLLDVLGLKRGAVKNLLKFGAIHVNGAAVRQFDHLLSAGDEVTVLDLHAAAAVGRLEQARVRPVFEDDALIVVDKPAGLLTVATARERADTLQARLNEFLRGRNSPQPERAWVVHRLDRDTSGLVLFAKSESVKDQLQAAWPTVEKTYFAVVLGCPTPDQGTVKSYLIEDSKSLMVFVSDHPRPGARLAITHYRVLKTRGDLSQLEVRLETGRKHQIRVHLASLGCPLVGDRRYGHRSDASSRLALHAASLVFVHPATGERLALSSPLPAELRKLIG